jgi:hypothetical protein
MPRPIASPSPAPIPVPPPEQPVAPPPLEQPSGLQRKFQQHCHDHPDAPECLLYDV